MKRLEAKIYFYDNLWARVYTVEPFDKVVVEGIKKPLDENSILDRYYALTGDNNDELELIQRDEKPLKFVAFLYQGLSGSYMRASEAEVTETDEIIKKEAEKRGEESITLDIPNIDYYPETMEWLSRARKTER